jgi:Protein of unknown function (DUF3631)/Bifunctional DNA primase/polymerase, N-terminal/Primase C terminal 1 (PriCT-1)
MTSTKPRAEASENLNERVVLRVAEHHFRLFPVEEKGKRPLLADWQRKATCDVETLKAWFHQYPGCNWGLATGSKSGVFVVDVDGEEGAAKIREISEHYGYDWTETLSVKTARGAHLYFNYPQQEIRNSVSKLGRGLDVRGEGGYVLVPPSVHPSGAIYRWNGHGEDTETMLAPGWLLEMITTRAKHTGPRFAGGDEIIPEGRRNTTLTTLAGAMRRQGMTPQAIEAALLAENAGRCRPPLPESEVQEIARSVSRYTPTLKPRNCEQETAALLTDARHFIRRFLVISDAQAVALCLFVLYTYGAEQFECAPYLQITSAEKRSGKSRLLEVLALLVNRPWQTSRTSAAALVRKLHDSHPTLLLDESDAAFGGDKEYSEALRGVLNAGHRKGGKVSLCLGKGSDIKVVDFDVFGPKVIAGIGRLPDTVADRTIPIQLHRKRPGENVERFRPRLIAQDASDLQGRLRRWATKDRLKMLRVAWPELPESLSDRQQDVSEPLLAVADLASSESGKVGRAALTELFGSTAAVDESLGARLLSDIRIAFDGRDRLSSKELVATLVEIDGSPWPELNHGREITTNTVARLLRKFDITPRTIRDAKNTFKGYLRESFEDAWTRYLGPHPSTPARPAVTPSQAAKTLSEIPFSKRSQTPDVTPPNSEEETVSMGLVTPVTVQTSEPETRIEKSVFIGEL